METQTKPWWQSKTIWTGLLTSISAVLSAAGVLPPFITDIFIDHVVTALLGIATIVFRVKADKKVTTTA